jgi:hypothetical protein
MRLLARLRCMFSGHDDHRVCEPRRFRLRCADCGRETRGWQIDPWGPRLTEPGDQQRHVLFNPRLGLATRRGAPSWLRGIHERRGA